MTELLTLELGKVYRTRDGFQCGPMELAVVDRDEIPPSKTILSGYIKGTGVRVFKIDGGAHAYGETSLDLVAEWVDESEEAGSSGPPIVGGESVLDTFRRSLKEAKGALLDAAAQKSEAEAIADEHWGANDIEAARAAVFNFDLSPETVTAIADAASEAYATGQSWLYTDVDGTRRIDPPNDFDTSKMTVKVGYANEYRTEFTNTPPVLSVRDGHLIISLTNGSLTLEASVGDGRYFFSQVVEHLINPALRARQTTHAFAAKWMREHGIGSPND